MKTKEIEAKLFEARKRFDEIQRRDDLPDDVGISHCRKCHGAFNSVEEYLYDSVCGHWIGCPEC